MARAELGCCARTSQVLFVIIQVIFFLLGTASLALGIYLLVVGMSFGSAFTGTNYVSFGALLVVCGGISWIITIFGCLGAIGLWRPLLAIYVGVVVLVVVLEIVAGILGFVYRNDIESTIESTIRRLVSEYGIMGLDEPPFNEEVNDAVDYIQNLFDCCGSVTATEYESENPNYFFHFARCMPATSCECMVGQAGCANFTITNTTMADDVGCGNRLVYQAWNKGCVNGTRDALLYFGYTAGGVGIAFGIVEILAIILAIILIVVVSKSNKDQFV